MLADLTTRRLVRYQQLQHARSAAAVLHDAGETTLSMRRGPDGGWRFDAGTLGRLPALRLAAAKRRRERTAAPANLREGLTASRRSTSPS